MSLFKIQKGPREKGTFTDCDGGTGFKKAKNAHDHATELWKLEGEQRSWFRVVNQETGKTVHVIRGGKYVGNTFERRS